MINRKRRRQINAMALNIAVAIVGIIIICPLVWMISASFKPVYEIYRYPPTIIPEHFTLNNYTQLMSMWQFGTWYKNSLMVAVPLTLAVLFFTSLAGFGFAKYRFRGSKLLFTLLLGSTMIPFQLILLPLFIFMVKLRWTNTYASLVIPFMAPAAGVFLMRQFLMSIPSEILEAARIDGASEFGIYWRVVLPLARPALAAQGVLTFLGVWNSFLWPLTVLHGSANFTLPVGVAGMTFSLSVGSERPIGAGMAAATLITIPVILIFVAVQKQYIASLTAISVKE